MITQHTMTITYLMFHDGQIQVSLTCGDTPANQAAVLHCAIGMVISQIIQAGGDTPSGIFGNPVKTNPN